jgi:hypothetical protein
MLLKMTSGGSPEANASRLRRRSPSRRRGTGQTQKFDDCAAQQHPCSTIRIQRYRRVGSALRLTLTNETGGGPVDVRSERGSTVASTKTQSSFQPVATARLIQYRIGSSPQYRSESRHGWEKSICHASHKAGVKIKRTARALSMSRRSRPRLLGLQPPGSRQLTGGCFYSARA